MSIFKNYSKKWSSIGSLGPFTVNEAINEGEMTVVKCYANNTLNITGSKIIRFVPPELIFTAENATRAYTIEVQLHASFPQDSKKLPATQCQVFNRSIFQIEEDEEVEAIPEEDPEWLLISHFVPPLPPRPPDRGSLSAWRCQPAVPGTRVVPPVMVLDDSNYTDPSYLMALYVHTSYPDDVPIPPPICRVDVFYSSDGNVHDGKSGPVNPSAWWINWFALLVMIGSTLYLFRRRPPPKSSSFSAREVPKKISKSAKPSKKGKKQPRKNSATKGGRPSGPNSTTPAVELRIGDAQDQNRTKRNVATTTAIPTLDAGNNCTFPGESTLFQNEASTNPTPKEGSEGPSLPESTTNGIHKIAEGEDTASSEMKAINNDPYFGGPLLHASKEANILDHAAADTSVNNDCPDDDWAQTEMDLVEVKNLGTEMDIDQNIPQDIADPPIAPPAEPPSAHKEDPPGTIWDDGSDKTMVHNNYCPEEVDEQKSRQWGEDPEESDRPPVASNESGLGVTNSQDAHDREVDSLLAECVPQAALQHRKNYQYILYIDGMTCEGCERVVRNAMSNLSDVTSVVVSWHDHSATIVSWAPRLDLLGVVKAMEDVGYGIFMGPTTPQTTATVPLLLPSSPDGGRALGAPPGFSHPSPPRAPANSSLSLMDELRTGSVPVRRYSCGCGGVACICSARPVLRDDPGREVSLSDLCSRLERNLAARDGGGTYFPFGELPQPPGSSLEEWIQSSNGGSGEFRQRLAAMPIPCGCGTTTDHDDKDKHEDHAN